MENKEIVKELLELNVNDKTEKRSNGSTELTYLSWSWAWAELIKRYPDATYEICKFENNLPYVYDESTGYMVFTKVQINGIEREMWLPVMDGANKSMLNHDYTYTVKKKIWNDFEKKYDYKEEQKECKKATMFDINKTIMRCLTKNLAMFGLGLYIYSGEDLPELVDDDVDYKKAVEDYIKDNDIEKMTFCKEYGLTGKSTQYQFKEVLEKVKNEK